MLCIDPIQGIRALNEIMPCYTGIIDKGRRQDVIDVFNAEIKRLREVEYDG